MPSNPAPRPALTRTDTGLARPPLRRPAGAAPLAPEPAPAQLPEPGVPAEASTERTGGKSKKSKHGQKHGRDYKDNNGRGKKPETVEVTVTLTKLTRRALKDAAEERGMAPEELASLIVSAWLDH